MYELTFSLKYYMNFSIEEINNMTTHESKAYLKIFRETKEREKKELEEARQSLRDSAKSLRSLNRRRHKGRR